MWKKTNVMVVGVFLVIIVLLRDFLMGWEEVSVSEASSLALVWERDGLECKAQDAWIQQGRVRKIECELYTYE